MRHGGNVAMTARLSLLLLAVTTVLCFTSRSRGDSTSPRKIELFDSNWSFHLGDEPNAQSADFDEHDWRRLDLPHDWSIEQPFDEKLASGTGFLPGGIGWYRKSFTLASAPGRHVAVRFDGVYMNAQVWINGHDLGTRPNGFVSFEYDLTPFLRADDTQPNVLAVRVDHSHYDDSRFYTGSGIYRHVWLIATGDIAIAPWGVFVSTPKVSTDVADVNIFTAVENRSDRDAAVTVESQLIDETGSSPITVGASATIAAHGARTEHSDTNLNQPHLWSCDHPAVYRLVTTVKVGNAIVDQLTTPFGVRSIAFDTNRGFLLNGGKTLIKGVCLHQDAGCFGAAAATEVFARRLRLLKELGCNAIRTSHNPPPPELLDLCDQMGFLVMDEAFDEWARPKKKWVTARNSGTPSTHGYSEYFNEWSERDLSSMVQRDRNHPSIVLWSIGNEIDYNHDPYWDPTTKPLTTTQPSAAELPPIARKLAATVHALDRSRPVTAALASIAVSNKTGLPEALDVVGYNYQERQYDADHKSYPTRKITGSENNHMLIAWDAVEQHSFIGGQFLWTGFDYLGEAERWPDHGSAAGVLDECGFKKPAFYFRQSLWSDKPMVYLAVRRHGAARRRDYVGPMLTPAWILPERFRAAATEPSSSSLVDIVCFTNCKRVELFLNGRTLGSKRLSDAGPDRMIEWTVPFAPGELRALGYGDGIQPACSWRLAAPGEPDHVQLTADQPNVGEDEGEPSLTFVEADVVDKDGNPVYTARNQINFTITAPAKIRGVDSGDLTDAESFFGKSRRAFRGKCLVVVESRNKGEAITLRASGDGLKVSEASIDGHTR
jgi:beta-galactosidase